MKILVTGAHPDDPESGCGGTICAFKRLGHEVVVLYLARGEAYSIMARIIEEEKPDVVFTNWPIDTHPDHRVNSNLVYNTWN